MQATWVKEVQRGKYAIFGQWAGMYCEGQRERLGACDLLRLGFSQSAFLAFLADDRQDRPIEADPSFPLASAFRDACLSLQPEVAFMTSDVPAAFEGSRGGSRGSGRAQSHAVGSNGSLCPQHRGGTHRFEHSGRLVGKASIAHRKQ